jgi:hypothetical protein
MRSMPYAVPQGMLRMPGFGNRLLLTSDLCLQSCWTTIAPAFSFAM